MEGVIDTSQWSEEFRAGWDANENWNRLNSLTWRGACGHIWDREMSQECPIDALILENQKLKEEIEAAFEIIESLPVDPHDMEVHYWCDEDSYCREEGGG